MGKHLWVEMVVVDLKTEEGRKSSSQLFGLDGSGEKVWSVFEKFRIGTDQAWREFQRAGWMEEEVVVVVQRVQDR